MPGTQEGDYTLEVDTETNRLYMKLDGMLDAETGQRIVDELEEEYVPQLEPGFDLVNDISEFKPVSQDATQAIERGKQLIAGAGVSAVARVMGDSVIGKMQFERHGDDDYHTTTAESREQAESFLDRFREDDR